MTPESEWAPTGSRVESLTVVSGCVDNAYDADVQATAVHINLDLIKWKGKKRPILWVKDDGAGMSKEGLHRMLGFGHSHKDDIDAGYQSVGQYGKLWACNAYVSETFSRTDTFR